MCPYKVVYTRVDKKKWLTKEIYSLIRTRKRLVKQYRTNKDTELLNDIRIARNRVNSAIDSAKIDYVKHLLTATRKDPKKFWRNIKTMLNVDNNANLENVFINPDTGKDISYEETPSFLNNYFAQIANRVCRDNFSRDYVPMDKVDSTFVFMPPEQYEIMFFAENIDLNSASGVPGINMKICKSVILHIPSKIRLLCANSLFMGIFPEDWTLATVKLLPKSGNLANPGNWRPISLTNVFSKLLEKIVHTQLLTYLLNNSLISERQYGFLPNKSTHEAIFKTIHDIYTSINNKKLLGMMLLDIAKAFNCINHDILFNKMEKAGFGPVTITWFKSYLNRKQQVALQGRLSSVATVVDGIAQGTVLGPILFIFYINDVINRMKYVNITLFADDCIIYLSGNNWQTVQEKIQCDFDTIVDWSFRNNLRLNYDKTKAMVFSTRNRILKLTNPTPFKMRDIDIKFVKSHVYLGVTLRARQIRFYPGCPPGNHMPLLGCPTYDTGCPNIMDQKSYK